jgi:membrane protein YdbS with pleckstrin-like domain
MAGMDTEAAPSSVAGVAAHEPEREVWEGRYSPLAIIGQAVAAGIVTIILLVVALIVRRSETWWLLIAGAPILWMFLGLRYVYKRLSIEYRLTNLWFEQKLGILFRTIHRMDVITIEDIKIEQSPIEQLTGVGSIHILTRDRNDPDVWLAGIDNVDAVSKKFDDIRLAQRRRRSMLLDGGNVEHSS